MSQFEWRVCWHGGFINSDSHSDWEEYDGQGETEDEIMEDLNERTGTPSYSIAEERFWEATSVEYWVEVREVQS